VNRTLNALRKVRRIARVELELEDDDNGSAGMAVSDVEIESDRTFLAESIDTALRRLAPGARTVFTLHDVEGYTHEEIAQELGITAGGSKSQLAKARAKLRRLLGHLADDLPPPGGSSPPNTSPHAPHPTSHISSSSQQANVTPL
jgi:RNA polymerase sigma-70 factor (ECF subfamily)